MAEKEKTALIIGAGPAGLTAAVQFLRESNIRPIVMEASDSVGGISRTVNFQGYRMDLGGHRFFSKSDWVMDWWQQMLPLDPAVAAAPEEITLSYHNRHRRLKGLNASSAAADAPHKVMLLRNRLSRIYFGRKFYDYRAKYTEGHAAHLVPAPLSPELYELVMELEDQYGITVSEQEAAEIKTVGDAVDFVVAKAVA